MSTLVPDEISMEDHLCDSSLGSMVSLDYFNPLTGGAANEHLRVAGRVGRNEVAAVEAIIPECVTVVVNGSVTASVGGAGKRHLNM